MAAETQDQLQHLLQDVTDAGVADEVSVAMFAMAVLYEDGLLALVALAGTIGLGAAIIFYAIPRLSEVLG